MSNPYLLDTPAVVSFSGGRTSGYMLWHILQAHGGTLPDGVKVVFCNTGKERPETLDFVERCSQQWGVPVTWLEYRYDNGPAFVEVDYTTASRHGEPLEAVIMARCGASGYLPNPLVRYCTIEAKILTTVRYLKSLGWDHWTNAIGFRADEPLRIAKLGNGNRCQDEDPVCPLASAGVTKADVLAWWRRQPFDLRLQPWESNCDHCFLKDRQFILAGMRDDPGSAGWWIRMEQGGGLFRSDRADYATMLELSQRPGLFDDFDPDAVDELSISCHCTD